MDNPTWMYRRAGDGAVEARIFDAGGIPADEGWRDSPATLAQAEPSTIDAMSKDELEAYALGRFGVDLDRRRTLKTLRAQVRALESETQEKDHGDDRA